MSRKSDKIHSLERLLEHPLTPHHEWLAAERAYQKLTGHPYHPNDQPEAKQAAAPTSEANAATG